MFCCQNCKELVDIKFKYAIEHNICPVCGGKILGGSDLSSYFTLKKLLEHNGFEDTSELAMIIVSHFELSQKDKTKNDSAPKKKSKSVKQKNTEQDDDDVSEEIVTGSEEEDDEEFKKKQMKEAKEILNKIREQEYDNALRRDFGMDEIDEFEGNSTVKAVLTERKRQSTQNILDGTRGAFRRT